MEKNINRLETKVQVLDEAAVGRALMRISYEIVEKCSDLSNLVLVGIRTRGVPIAGIIAENIKKNSGAEVPVGSLDITFYRDDLEKIDESPKVGHTEITENINGKEIILIDDVLYTGRTVRAAIDALFSLGRPGKIRLAVLIDRGHRELPIRPDYVGKNIPTSLSEVIKVHIDAADGKTGVDICRVVDG
ncbi:MAG: bifunctional pyr operon transcriptional regulator/uracil phosphoribosyltransferase PyrR [Acutalibacteraceae bacterium]